MVHRSRIQILLPLLAMSLTLGMIGSAQAQDASANFQVTFGSRPHWTSVQGTRVQEIRQADRPDYDMFRYGGNYYAYNNNRW